MNTFILVAIIFESILLLVVVVLDLKKSLRLSNLRKNQLRSQESMDDFFPMLVHELRSPLSVIKGASDLLIKESHQLGADQIQTLLSQIRNSSSSLLSMVNDILDISKLEANRFEVSKTFGNVNDILNEVTGYFNSTAQVKNVSLTTDLDQSIQHFSFDPERLKQVLNNLLSNALKFTPENGTIVVTSSTNGTKVKIGICDTGVGIPDKDKPRLFHKFVQADNQKGVKEKGTGLGLVISKGIVEAHGGKIWVEDNKPSGSCFIFTLPIV